MIRNSASFSLLFVAKTSFLVFFLSSFCFSGFSQTITTSAVSGSPFCAGAAVNVPYTITGSFTGGNVFTAQLSDAAGSFASPTAIGTLAATTAGTISATIPLTQAAGTLYRIRVVSSTPVITGTDNGANLTVTALGLSAPTISGSPFCAGSTFNITNNLANACTFGAGNTFSVQMSNSAGSFASPTTIGSLSTTSGGSISVTIPLNATAGAGYKIQVVSSSPVLTSAASSAFTITALGLSAPTVTGSPFCAGSTFNITNNLANACTFGAGNTFSVQLSDAAGSFASPTTIGSLSTTSGGSISVTIPLTAAAGAGYKMQVVSSNPVLTSSASAAFTINALGINAPTVSSPMCQGATFNITNNLLNACAFGSGNTFTVQLSDATGSFTSPTAIGTGTTSGAISVTIPQSQATGTLYKVRVISSNPAIIGTATGSLTLNAPGLNAPTGTATRCAGTTFTLTNNLTGCNFFSGNTFTAYLSDAAGSFASPTSIGTLTATSGNISVTLPATATSGAGYKIQVVSSSPVVTSPASAAFQINAIALNAPTFGSTTYCQGATFTLTYSFPNACPFVTGNTFTAQLSDAFGGFSSPTTIGTTTATAAGNFSVTIPTSTPAGNAYRIRVVASNPAVTSPDNGANITVNAFGISLPSFAATSFCQNSTFALTYTILNSCNFPNTPSANVFTAQLSDALGSFASPTTIGTVTSATNGTINVTIPSNTPAGSGYRIRIVSSNPGTGVIGPDNGTNLNIAATAGTPSVFGNGVWNAYVYNSNNFTNYSGFYTENNLSFNSASRFATSAAPSNADASSGLAYSGCTTNAAPWSISYKRTNFTCGYYQIDIPTHDDNLTLFINGVSVYSVACCTSNLTNVWTGFLGPASTVEFQIVNGGGPGNLSATFSNPPNPLSVSSGVSICSGASTTLTASSSAALTYVWNPGALSGASVSVSPTSTTTYTVTGTDAVTGCSVTGSVLVTVSNSFTTAVSSSLATICSGVNTSTLTASGANTYTWSPATGLSATTGNVVTANPASTTTYTVTGSNGCTTNSANVTVTVQNIPASPVNTTFGNGAWNVFCHNNTTWSNYYGYYTENNLSFNTTSRWNANNGPTVANAASGLAYSGCTFGTTNYSMSFRRTNFTCGYYQIDIPFHDDNVTLLIDGTQVFQHNGCCDAHSNVWTGFLGASSTVEFLLINGAGPGSLQVAFSASTSSPQSLNSNSTICAGTTANLSASSSLAGATYTWSISPADPSISFSPSNTGTNPFVVTTASTPATTYTVTNVLTDAAGTGCTASATTLLTVNPLPTTAVTPTSVTTSCPSAGITLTASGANTYAWSPATGLSATTGFSVVASPTVTTTYTVSGSNNCSVNSATTTITVVVPPAYTTFPSGTWNVYGFNSTTVGTNYVGYYTENGSGASTYDFNTATRWTSGAAPSTANATNGTAWQGCTMNATNMSMSFKRTNFACGVYQINILNHDDGVILLINGTQVAAHNGCCDTHTAIWTGVLNSASTVEWQLVQGGGGSGLSVQFVPVSQTANIWSGSVSSDWSNAANWCTSVPTSTTDAIIFAAGPQNMPSIISSGAVVRNLTVNGAIALGAYNSAIAAASITTATTNNLDVYGNWTNNGTYTANTGSVSFVGANAGNTISNASPTTFYNLILNKTNPITNSSGIIQVSNNLTFTAGVLTQNASLKILNGGSVSGASNTSFVNGTVTKVGNTAFTFPVGSGTFYRPISISAPSLTTDNFTAQYFNSSANGTYPLTQKAATFDHVSAAEYWILNRTGGTSNVAVTLSWNTNSGGVGNISTLRVARWDASSSKWLDEGSNGSPTGNTTAGTVTSAAAVSTFSSPNSPFTLGTADNFNTLPVELTNFSCALQPENVVRLTWITRSELNNDSFEVERSVNGAPFTLIGSVKGAGTTSSQHNYLFNDNSPVTGRIYYRLAQIDFDGKKTYSEVCSVEVEAVLPQVSIYPNPAANTATIDCNGLGNVSALRLLNSLGEEIFVMTDIQTQHVQLNTGEQPNGLYFVEVVSAKGRFKSKLIIAR